MLPVLMIVLSGYLGFFVFKKLNLPVPVVLGPLTFSAIANLTGIMNFSIPRWISMLFVIGVAISVTQNFEFKLNGILKDLTIVIIYTIGTGILAFLYLSFYGMNPQTAYFSAMPGGGADLALISMDFEGADPFCIVLYQTIRFFAVVLAYPYILRWFIKQKDIGSKIGKKMNKPINLTEAKQYEALMAGVAVNDLTNSFNKQETKTINPKINNCLIAIIFIIGIVFAMLLKMINFAGNNYLGGMIATILISNILNKKFKIKPKMNRATATFFKISSCSVIGLQVTWDSIAALIQEWPALIVMNLIIIFSGILLGWIFYRLGWADLVTAMLETAPSGVLPMSVMAEELNGDVVRVSLFQLIRIIFIVMLAPILQPLLIHF